MKRFKAEYLEIRGDRKNNKYCFIPSIEVNFLLLLQSNQISRRQTLTTGNVGHNPLASIRTMIIQLQSYPH